MKKGNHHNPARLMLLVVFLFTLYIQENPEIPELGESSEHTTLSMFVPIPLALSSEDTYKRQDDTNNRLTSCSPLFYHTFNNKVHTQNTFYTNSRYQFPLISLAATPPVALRAPPADNIHI